MGPKAITGALKRRGRVVAHVHDLDVVHLPAGLPVQERGDAGDADEERIGARDPAPGLHAPACPAAELFDPQILEDGAHHRGEGDVLGAARAAVEELDLRYAFQHAAVGMRRHVDLQGSREVSQVRYVGLFGPSRFPRPARKDDLSETDAVSVPGPRTITIDGRLIGPIVLCTMYIWAVSGSHGTTRRIGSMSSRIISARRANAVERRAYRARGAVR